MKLLQSKVEEILSSSNEKLHHPVYPQVAKQGSVGGPDPEDTKMLQRPAQDSEVPHTPRRSRAATGRNGSLRFFPH